MPRPRVLCRATLVVGVFFSTVCLHGQSPGEFTVNTAGGTTLDSTLTLTGDSYPLATDDLAFESTGQRNAFVVYGGGSVTLASGAQVAVANANNLTVFLRVGYGSSGSMLIEDGASLTVGSASRYANVQIGQGATGSVVQTGGTFTSIGSFNVGVNGGSGTYTISDGSLLFDNAGATAANKTSLISIGFNNATSAVGTSAGTFNIEGGLVQVGPTHDGGVVEFIIGNRAKDSLAAYNNGVATTAGAGNGVVNQTGGIFRIGAGAGLFLSAYGNGTYNLSGGTLEIGGSSLHTQYGNQSGYTYAFNFGGGTIKVIDSALTTEANLTLVAGASSTIDTNGFAATFSGNLTAAGLHQIDYGGNALVKTGTGTLILSGSSRVLDTFAITGGTAQQTTGATSAVEFMAGTGSGNTGGYVMNGGSLTITPSTKTNGDPVAGSLRVGDFSGTGTFTQNAGMVTLQANSSLNIGNQGGSGTYNLNGGTLTLNSGLHVLGRSAEGKPVSRGTLNIAGGVMQIASGASLINGNNMPNGAAGTGTINQTGGVLRVNAGAALFLSGYTNAGAGTYNLSGGTLEVGGSSSFYGRYNNSNTTYAFNFGSGTLKVVGSALDANVATTLTAASTATIDTNGLGATWRGVIGGSGGLQKSGAGTLTLTGAITFSGATTVNAGSLIVSGSLNNSTITVGSGATLGGHGTLGDVNILGGGTLAPGGTAGALTLTGDLSLAGTSQTLLYLADTSIYDQINVSGTLSAGGNLSVSAASDFSFASGNSFDLFDGTIQGTFASISLPTLSAGQTWDLSGLYSTGTIAVAASAVPEPATWSAVAALLAGIAAGFGRWRTRRRSVR